MRQKYGEMMDWIELGCSALNFSEEKVVHRRRFCTPFFSIAAPLLHSQHSAPRTSDLQQGQVQFHDVPGCFSAADSMDQVVGNATEALSLWAEDTPLPAPRSIEKIVKNRHVAAELAGGAFLISVPVTENDTRVVSANISLERGMLKAIGTAAKRRKLTGSAFLAQAARKEIKR